MFFKQNYIHFFLQQTGFSLYILVLFKVVEKTTGL